MAFGSKEPLYLDIGRAARVQRHTGKKETGADIILAGGGVVCLLVLFYFIYHYSLTGERQFTSSGGTVVYYIFPAALAGLCFASLLLPASRKINFALVLLSTSVSIYAAETILSVITIWSGLPSVISEMENNKRVEAAKKVGVYFDSRGKLEVVEYLRRKGIDAYPTSHVPELLEKQTDGSLRSKLTIDGAELLPLGWISNRVSVVCNEGGDYTIYESDEHGFHNPKGLWNNAGVQIVALGDSYTQGYCVPSDKNFVALIRKRYPATLDLGMAGEGPLSELATLREYADIIRPKVALWFYYEGNDLENLQAERNTPLLMRYTSIGFHQHLFNRQADIDRAIIDYIKTATNKKKAVSTLKQISAAVGSTNSLLKTINEIIRLSQVRQSLGLIYGSSREKRNTTPKGEMDLFRSILLQAKDSVNAWGGSLYFVYLTAWERYKNPEVAAFYREEVLKLVNSLDIPLIDIHPVFQIQGDPLSLFPFRQFGHYNEEGHRLVAEYVLDVISPGD